jgi:hypothetical protein
MSTHAPVLGAVVPSVVTFLLALFVPAPAAGQAPSRDTTAAAAPVKDLPLTAAQRQAFVGTYSVTLPFGEQTSLRIFEENGALKGQPENDPNSQEGRRLLYQGDNVFRPEGADFVLTFVLENGRATKFTARREDGVMEGTRIP